MESKYIHFWGILSGMNTGFKPDFYPDIPVANSNQKWTSGRFPDSRILMPPLFDRGLGKGFQVDLNKGVYGVTFYKKTSARENREAYTAGTIYVNASELNLVNDESRKIKSAIGNCSILQQSYTGDALPYPDVEDFNFRPVNSDSNSTSDARKTIVLSNFNSDDCSTLFDKLKGYNCENYTLYVIAGSLEDEEEETIRKALNLDGSNLFFLKGHFEGLSQWLYEAPLQEEVEDISTVSWDDPYDVDPITPPPSGKKGIISLTLVSLMVGLLIGGGGTYFFLDGNKERVIPQTAGGYNLMGVSLDPDSCIKGDTISMKLTFEYPHFNKNKIKIKLNTGEKLEPKIDTIIGSKSGKIVKITTVIPEDLAEDDYEIECSYLDSTQSAELHIGPRSVEDPPPHCSDGTQNESETGVDCGGSCPACPTCSDRVQNGDETGVDCGGSCDPCPEEPENLKNFRPPGDAWNNGPIKIEDLEKKQVLEYRKWANSTEDFRKKYGKEGSDLDVGFPGKTGDFKKSYEKWSKDYYDKINGVTKP